MPLEDPRNVANVDPVFGKLSRTMLLSANLSYVTEFNRQGFPPGMLVTVIAMELSKPPTLLDRMALDDIQIDASEEVR